MNKEKEWRKIVRKAKKIAGTMGIDEYSFRAIDIIDEYVIRNFLKK